MDIKVKGFFIPHNGESHYSCADSIAVNSRNNAMAIADGVGGSFDPKFLSRHITEDFVDNPLNMFDINSSLMKIDYQSYFENHCHKQYDTLSEIEKMCWELQKERKGISSECTFIGCVIENNKWRYFALGDSYLFFIDAKGNLTKISSMADKEFDVHPEYFSTTGRHKGVFVTGELPIKNGTLLLMTDALSEWFLKYYEEDPTILTRILDLNSHSEYAQLCEKELIDNHMHDDDCALLLAQITNAELDSVHFETTHLDTFENISTMIINQMSLQNSVLKKQIEELQSQIETQGEKKVDKYSSNDNSIITNSTNVGECDSDRKNIENELSSLEKNDMQEKDECIVNNQNNNVLPSFEIKATHQLTNMIDEQKKNVPLIIVIGLVVILLQITMLVLCLKIFKLIC